MTSVPTAVRDERHIEARAQPPVTVFGPHFPYAYDDRLAHPPGSARCRPPRTARRSSPHGGAPRPED